MRHDTSASDLEQILEVVGHHLEIHFHCGAAILLPADRLFTLRFRTPDFTATVQELEAAALCWEHGEPAGAETKVVPSALAHYLPLTVRGQVIGVLGLKPRPDVWFPAAQRELLAAFLSQSALAIEQGILEQRLRRLRFVDESERLQSALLAAVSHEVRASSDCFQLARSGSDQCAATAPQSPHKPLEPSADRDP